MTNPFQKADSDAPAEADPFTAPGEAKAAADAKATEVATGDPFADATGIGGEFITDFVDYLMLVKPTEVIPELKTKKAVVTNAVRADIALLDGDRQGDIIPGVLLLQQALRREAKEVFDGPNPYLIGRLRKGVTGGGNDLFTFDPTDDAEKDLARQFLKVKKL